MQKRLAFKTKKKKKPFLLSARAIGAGELLVLVNFALEAPVRVSYNFAS